MSQNPRRHAPLLRETMTLKRWLRMLMPPSARAALGQITMGRAPKFPEGSSRIAMPGLETLSEPKERPLACCRQDEPHGILFFPISPDCDLHMMPILKRV